VAREPRTVRFIRVFRCLSVRQIDGSARSHICFAVRVYWIPWQKQVGSEDRFVTCSLG
jgi:hypothetical protein